MRTLAQSLADTFGVATSYPDRNGQRQTAQPRPWQSEAQHKRRAERQLDKQRQQQREAKRGVK